MQGIKAFVGHSFINEDKILVRAFTDHFDTLNKSHGSGFIWDHAEEAEAAPLSQKVLAKIEGKNLFVGICTRKEQIFDPAKVKVSWFGARTLTDRLTLTGTYERPPSPFASILMDSPTTPTPPTKMKIEYKGRLRGQLFIGNVTRTPAGYTSTLADTPTKVLMIMDADGAEFRSMENYENTSPNFGILKAAAKA